MQMIAFLTLSMIAQNDIILTLKIPDLNCLNISIAFYGLHKNKMKKKLKKILQLFQSITGIILIK